MLHILPSVFVYITEMLISYIFFSKVSEKKKNTLSCILTGMLIFSVGIVFNLLCKNTIWINYLTFTLINIFFSVICFKIKVKQAIFLSALLTVFMGALESIPIFLLAAISNTNVNDYNSDFFILLIDTILSKMLYFITCLILAKVIKKDPSNARFPFSFYIYPLSASVALVAFWFICTQYAANETVKIILAIVSILLFCSAIFLFITYQHNIEKENRFILVNSELERLKTEKNYYAVLERQNEQLMIYAHDAKKHLAIIKSLNKNPQIDEYLNRMSDDLQKYSNSYHSGNITLDVIIGRYKTECEIKQISFAFDVRLNNLLFVDAFDLVALLDNLLDNALESAECSAKKEISFETDRRNSYEVIIITNSCDKKPIKEHNQPITTKTNKKMHGFGLKSVLQTLKKYDGDICWDYEEQKKTFITTVMLKDKSSSLT